MVRTLPRMTSCGEPIDPSPDDFGFLRDSRDAVGDFAELRQRMDEDGYLFLPGFLNRNDVARVRAEICQTLAGEGLLDPGTPVEQAIARPGVRIAFRPDIANASTSLKEIIYGPAMMALYDGLFEEPSAHYDYTWMRVVAPGLGTQPHCDIVYMGRGTSRLYTAWVPFGDIPIEVGGLIVLEGSHRLRHLKETYGRLDVDSHCENAEGISAMERAGFLASGAVAGDPAGLRARLGGRWLTADFQVGDLLTFEMFLVHGSLDNGSDQIRLSTDSRYQRASDPFDERWVGEHPIGHGEEAKRALIC